MIEIINRLIKLPYLIEKKDYVYDLLSYWSEFIKKHSNKYPFPIEPNQQIYPLEHIINGDVFVMHFQINHVRELIYNSTLVTSQNNLTEIIDDLSYVEMNSTVLSDDALDTPLIAVVMPTIKNGVFKSYALIDGNHRLSAAVYSKINIPITCILDTILHPYLFTSMSNFILYNMLLGFNLITSGSIDAEGYLDFLKQRIIV